MDRQVPVFSLVQPLEPSHPASPVLAAMIGTQRRRATVIACALSALGDSAIEVPLRRAMPIEDLRIAHKKISEHLANGESVLINGATGTKSDRRTLWDIASRHRASTLAVIRLAAPEQTAALVAEIAGEGWHAVAVTP